MRHILPFSLSLSSPSLFCCCCMSVHAYILVHAYFFFPSDIFLISEGMMRGGKKEKVCYEKKSLFINLFIVYEIKSFFSFSSCLSQMNV